jgi:two-component system, OmpR family, response regulator
MKVLVVEDNPKLARFLQKAFVEEGYAVDSVSDGETATQQVEQTNYDIIVLDWMLPGMDGITFCRMLRQRGSVVPILMLTARAEISERIAGLDAGADDYLPKPFDLGELLARARALMRRGTNAEVVLKVGGLCIDRLARKATVDARTLDLTPREFTLISLLAREAGRVVPRTELLRQVWETSFDPGSNIVDAHIKNLREKLGGAAKMIETVRGVGYRMVPSQAS